ncbi:MAG: response regulator [Pseudanabaenaceae cyanobacterium SKYGB_i_bin29]|nr:response regulator [Pseudanabaenaceae cyanobacterium SKYG29]MDW8422039.1 response regulator [Pseudanabaenaceae cyanobacterium SKYGB_i_bin29]
MEKYIETGTLVDILSALQSCAYTGTTRVIAKGIDRQCFLSWQEGQLTLADYDRLTPKRLYQILGKSIKFSFGNFSEDGGSIYASLAEVVKTGATTWDNIEKIILTKVILVLERLLPYRCTAYPEPQMHLDIAYSVDRHGFAITEIITQLKQRQEKWKKYAPVISSPETVVRVRPGALETIDNKTALSHLQRWVDGIRSIGDIAEALDQDPLTLAPLYHLWFKQNWLETCNATKQVSLKTLPVILVVDDSPIVRSMLSKALAPNYEVIATANAMEALGILNRTQVDLILLDVTMPEIDGFEFCRTIRKINKFKDTPVIMLTAKDGLIDRARGHLAGTNRYLTKPVNPEELLEAIRSYV